MTILFICQQIIRAAATPTTRVAAGILDGTVNAQLLIQE